LDGKAADQAQRNSLKIVVLDELIKVDAEKLKGDAKVVPEVKVVCHVHHIRRIFCIVFSQVLQNLDFDQRLMVKTLFISDNLYSGVCIRLVVKDANDLAERPFAKWVCYLIAVKDVIVQDDEVVTPLVIVRVVASVGSGASHLGSTLSEEPNLWKIQDLPLLVLSQLVQIMLQNLPR
jgi:hypothetical protein